MLYEVITGTSGKRVAIPRLIDTQSSEGNAGTCRHRCVAGQISTARVCPNRHSNRPGRETRITSYNVCYTKLLRLLGSND